MLEKIILIVLIVLASVFLIYSILMAVCFSFCFERNAAKTPVIKVPEKYKYLIKYGKTIFQNSEKTEIIIESDDDLKLHGYLIKGTKRQDKTIIFFHGYRSSTNDFAGAFPIYKKMGFNMIFVDQRAHGKSEGNYITFGVKESDDAVLWAKYAAKRFGGEIYLCGISMGASTVMLAADKDLPDEVKGIIADCGFTSPYDIIKDVSHKKYHVPKFLLPVVMGTMRLIGLINKFDIKKSSVDSLKNAKVPVIITHGKADKFVPYEMSVKNKEAGGDKVELVLVEDAKHGYAYVVDPVACFGAINKVFGDNSPVVYNHDYDEFITE